MFGLDVCWDVWSIHGRFFGRRILELINAWIDGLDVVYCSLFLFYIILYYFDLSKFVRMWILHVKMFVKIFDFEFVRCCDLRNEQKEKERWRRGEGGE